MRPMRHQPRKTKQCGAALMVMLVIMVMGAATFLVSSLGNSGLQISRDQKTAEVLAQAKDALIGYAVTNTDKALGSLPCPDTNDNGESDSGGNGIDCSKYIGRLPWKTLGITDLRDATGERLWYTLSRNVRHYDSVVPLNSDTAATPANKLLNVTGTYSADNLVAIIFAPGSPVGSQNRSSTNVTCTTTGGSVAGNLCASNYLEGSNDDLSTYTTQNTSYLSANPNVEFNDQLITISHGQLFSRVEQRVGGEFRRHLNNYYAAWGAYPFAATFLDPSSAPFRGSSSNYEGLYPFGSLNGIGSPPPNPEWSSSPITISFSSGSTPSFTCERRDSDWNNSRVRCTADASYATLPVGVTVTMTAKLRDVGQGFWKPFSLDVNSIDTYDSNEQVRVRDQYGNYDLAKHIFEPASVAVRGTLNYSDGSATVVFSAKGKSGGSKFQRIDMRDIQYESDNVNLPSWIQDNQWHRLLYYAVSPGNAPAGSGGSSINCTSTPGTYQCLTLSGANSGNDKKAVVIMTGQVINGIHPSATLSDYLEGENVTPADFTFENQTRSATFNDQVIIVAP